MILLVFVVIKVTQHTSNQGGSLYAQVDVPKELISPVELAALRIQRSPRYLTLEGKGNLHRYVDDVTGVIQCRLSNGIRVNYKV